MKKNFKSIIAVNVLFPALAIVIAIMMPVSLAAQSRDLSLVFKVPDNNVIPPGCTEYGAVITTGDAVGAGTDANIFLTINGDQGSTGEINITKSDSETKAASGLCSLDGKEFKLVKYGQNQTAAGDLAYTNNLNERNTSYLVAIWARDVGNVSSITVRSDNFGSAPDWFLQEIDLNDSVYAFNTWLKSGALSATATPTKKGSASNYDVNVYTGDLTGAGTDSNIDLTITGNGQSKTIRLNPLISGNAFERNQTDSLKLQNVPITQVDSITVTSDNSYAGSSWYLGWIEMSVNGNGNPGRFTCNCWIEGDTSSRTLTPDNPPKAAPTNPSNQQDGSLDYQLLNWYAQYQNQKHGGLPTPPNNTGNTTPPDTKPPNNPANPSASEQDCFRRAQGKVAWNQAGQKSWGEANLRALCKGTQNPETTINCFSLKMPQLGWQKAIAQCAGGGDNVPIQRMPVPPINSPAAASPVQLPGTARDIDAKNGSVWVIGTVQTPGGYHIRHLVGDKWQVIDGGGIRIAVDLTGNPWVITSDGKILRRVNNAWTTIPPPNGYTARDIAIMGDGTVWIITDAGSLTSWIGSGWTSLFGLNAKQLIALSNSNTLQAVDNAGKRWTHQSGPNWLIQPDASGMADKYTEFAVESDGTRWGVDSKFNIWRIGPGK